MCDASILNALLEQARSAPEVTVKSEILLQLLDPVMIVTLSGVKKRAKREKAPPDPEDERCARWLYGTLLRNFPEEKQPNYTTWANDIRVMRERDGRTRKEICALFLWAHQDSFWWQNVKCPKTLRKHWGTLAAKRDKAAEPRKNTAWWLSDETKLAKAIEVGVGPAHNGESSASWEARIRAAIDNGGKPPTPISMIRPQAQPTPIAELAQAAAEPARRAGRPEGLVQMMKEIGQVAPRGRAA